MKGANDEVVRVPIVCKCVIRNGGIKMEAPRLDPQRLSAALADQVRQMKPEARSELIAKLREHAGDESKDELVRSAIEQAANDLDAEAPPSGAETPAEETQHVDPSI